MSESKFEVGSKVLVSSRFEELSIGKVAKVYKNGNVVLEGSAQQYRPRGDWACSTGDGWHTSSISAWSPEVEERFNTANKLKLMRVRLYKVQKDVAALKVYNDAASLEAIGTQLYALEQALGYKE